MRNIDRWLAVGGLVVSLPGFLLMFLSTQRVAAALAVMLGLVLVTAAFIVVSDRSRPPFTMKSIAITLEFVGDATNVTKLARISRRYTFVPNFPHMRYITHRNIGADGPVQSICWDGSEIPAAQVKAAGGEYEATVVFPNPLARNKINTGTLSYEALDSFRSSREYLTHVVDFETSKLAFEINLPKPARQAEAFLKKGGMAENQIPYLELRKGNTQIVLEMTSPPPVGNRVEINWEW